MWLRLGRKILGGALIVLGIVGLFLPFLQGFLFIIAGAMLWGVERRQMVGWIDAAEWRWPWTRKLTSKVRTLLVREPNEASSAK